jgi:two-component system response regulator NreC
MASDRKIRVLLADDHAVFREGVRLLLETRGEFEVVGEAATGNEAVDLVRSLRPDVVLMDIGMPGMNGLEATHLIRTESPASRVLILTMHGTDEYFFNALDAGASGYVLKEAASSDLVSAIESVHRGGMFLYPSLATKLVEEYLRRVGSGEEKSSYDALTPREREVLQSIGEGRTNQEIADVLGLSVHTVQTHRIHIMNKLGLHNRAQLVSYAARLGLLSDSP